MRHLPVDLGHPIAGADVACYTICRRCGYGLEASREVILHAPNRTADGRCL